MLRNARWRLSPSSRVISTCINGTAGTACRGGTSAEEEGQGYCIDGHRGPLCQTCDQVSSSPRYFDKVLGICADCPDNKGRTLAVFLTPALGGLILIATLFTYQSGVGTTACKPDRTVVAMARRRCAVRAKSLMWKLHAAGLIPKFKLLIVFFQAVLSLKDAYAVDMPPGYDEVMTATFSWAEYNKLSRLVIPGGATACLVGGFYEQLLLVGGVPLAFCVGLFLLTLALEAVLHFVRRRKTDQPSLRGRLKTAPFVLFASFFLCPGVSAEVFAAWTCLSFVVDSDALPPTTLSYLRADLTVQCTDTVSSSEEHDRIKSAAIIFVIAWPIFWPACYTFLLLLCRSAIQKGKHTRLMLATSFLHSEYTAGCYLWEPLLLLQRLALTGFVRLLPVTRFERLVLGFALSFFYLLLLLLLRPYKRPEVGRLAALAQFVVSCAFFIAMAIQLLNELDATAVLLTGLTSTDSLATALLVFVFAVIGTHFLVILAEAISQEELQQILSVDTSLPPELSVKPGMCWHIFLSHTWNSAQDQCATIKRQLQLILPGVRVFLDVDDLDDMRKLKEYIECSQSVLFFLSKGYFFSGACKTEITAALAAGKPLLLVHDPVRGGAPLTVLQEDCNEQWRGQIFGSGRPIITWLRVADYQVISLKQIVAQLLHASPHYRSLAEPPRLYMPGELSRKRVQLHKHVVLAVSPYNPGATQVGSELADYLKTKGDGSNMFKLRKTATDASELESELEASERSQDLGLTRQATRRTTTRKLLASAHFPRRRLSSRQSSARTVPARFCEGASASDATHFLLYLSAKTFVGRLGAVLAEEVREARAFGLKVVLAHETDIERGGVEFESFFRTTPDDLIADQLFGPIATPLATGDHRIVSLIHLLRQLGAVASSHQLAITVPIEKMKQRLSSPTSSPTSSPRPSLVSNRKTVRQSISLHDDGRPKPNMLSKQSSLVSAEI